MRLLVKPTAPRSVTSRIAGLLALAIGGLMLGSAGPALSGRDAPAVWVPLAPAGTTPAGATPGAAEIGRPIVLVPFEHTVPAPGREPKAWTPAYLSPPGAAARDGRAPDGGGAVKTGRPSFTLSDVLRATDWRRETAERLRAEPAFKPPF